jgi:hypothetical protein
MSVSLPDDNTNINVRNQLLDPLSTIVKLAILGHKPPQTKVCIYNNVLYFQEPGPFQAFCRMIYSSNKTDLHYMYNPIQMACAHFLAKPAPVLITGKSKAEHNHNNNNQSSSAASAPSVTTDKKTTTRIKHLFAQAQRGLEKLMDTYKTNSTIRHTLQYYHILIANYVDEKYDAALFREDSMTVLYSEPVVNALNAQWNESWLTVVLDLVGFLSNDSVSAENIRALESLMVSVDANTRKLLA